MLLRLRRVVGSAAVSLRGRDGGAAAAVADVVGGGRDQRHPRELVCNHTRKAHLVRTVVFIPRSFFLSDYADFIFSLPSFRVEIWK